jgi:hypothetical protein
MQTTPLSWHRITSERVRKKKKIAHFNKKKLGARVYEATKNGAETSIELIHDSRFGSVNLFFLAVFCPYILLFLLLFFFFFFYDVLKFTFFFFASYMLKGVVERPAPPLSRPAFKGEGELAIRRFLLIFK